MNYSARESNTFYREPTKYHKKTYLEKVFFEDLFK